MSVRASQVALVVKNLFANTGNIRDMGSIPESGRSPGGGHGNPFQYSGLENPMTEEPGSYSYIYIYIYIYIFFFFLAELCDM